MAYPKLGRIKPTAGIRDGLIAKNHLAAIKTLKPVLQQWANLTNEYCDYAGDDNPYWYNEAANVSLLAAAVWKAGFVALEEYQTTKRMSLQKARSTRSRADLYIGRSSEFQIEAKQYWMHAHMKDSTLTRRIQAHVRAAIKAAQRNTEMQGRVGCVFFIVHFSQKRRYSGVSFKSKPEALVEREIRRYVQNNRNEANLWAWCFPNRTRKSRRKEKDQFRYYPGVILAMKAAKYFKA